MVKDNEILLFHSQRPSAEPPEPPKKKRVLPFQQKSNPTPTLYCTHRLECKLYTTKKSGLNFGRKFYACRKISIRNGANYKCKTFAWQDAVLGLPKELCYHDEACKLQHEDVVSKEGPWSWVCKLGNYRCNYKVKAKQLNDDTYRARNYQHLKGTDAYHAITID